MPLKRIRREASFLYARGAEILRDEGLVNVAKKGARYGAKRLLRGRVSKPQMLGLADVLFIDGCPLPHPSRYRVAHQVEQLCAHGLAADAISWQELRPEHVALYRAFVIFRCELTKPVARFIEDAQALGKPVLFDIDDLLFDEADYPAEHPDRAHYLKGVRNMGALLKLCDGAITTTSALAEALGRHVGEVVINRNVASEEMLRLSARVATLPTRGISICYASGSTTHDPDLALVAPAIRRVLDEHEAARFVTVGLVGLPPALAGHPRVKRLPFTDWKKLPGRLHHFDIHIAPVAATPFNEAKSENKWTEAALVKRPLVASPVGGFREVIRDGVDGLLASSSDDWHRQLQALIVQPKLRDAIALAAHERVLAEHTTVTTGHRLAQFMRKRLPRSVGIVLASTALGGGTLVALRHAKVLRHAGADVTLLSQSNDGGRIDDFPVVSTLGMDVRAEYDTLVATLWSTVPFVASYPRARTRAYLVQNFETEFFAPGDPRRQRANTTYAVPGLRYVTISRWCERWLQERFGQSARYAPNGIDPALFAPATRDWSGKRIVLIEGNSEDPTKNVDESFAVAATLDRDKYTVWYVSYGGKPKRAYRYDRFVHRVPHAEMPALYGQAHILLKSSRLESFSYPPLEMMATGGMVVVAANAGNSEYVMDGHNALTYAAGDTAGATAAIERLGQDPELRGRLAAGGRHTAEQRAWDQLTDQILALYA